METKYITILLLSFLLFGCEEDIIIDLAAIEKKLVVEAYVTNSENIAKVSLSYSQGFYDTPDSSLLTNARVSLTNQNGETEQLKLNDDNVYVSSELKAEFGNEYTLNVEVDEQSVEAKTILPSKIDIASVLFVPNPFFGSEDSLNTLVNVNDEVGVDNYFRLKVNKIGVEAIGEYFIVDDTFGKDGLITMPIYFKTYTYGDTVIVELQHLNSDMYDYYIGLADNLGGSFNSIAPGNPSSNMPEDIMGFIAGISSDIDTLIIESPQF